MRKYFVDRLFEYAKKDKNIMVLTADLGYGLFDDFRFKLPEQFLNVGVAESNLINVSAGLSMAGKNVFSYSITPFLMMRPFEQIRLNICYNHTNVKLLGAGGGLVYGPEGPTHHAYEDIALMRTLPGMIVFCPGDRKEVDALFDEIVKSKDPIYIRFGKKPLDKSIYPEGTKFSLGKANVVAKGKDIVIFSMGSMLQECYKVLRILNEKGISPTLISVHTVKPLDEKMIKEHAKNNKCVVVVEDHNIIGGLGSAIAETLIGCGFENKFLLIALPNKFITETGNADYLYSLYGLDAEKIADKILKETGGLK